MLNQMIGYLGVRYFGMPIACDVRPHQVFRPIEPCRCQPVLFDAKTVWNAVRNMAFALRRGLIAHKTCAAFLNFAANIPPWYIPPAKCSVIARRQKSTGRFFAHSRYPSREHLNKLLTSPPVVAVGVNRIGTERTIDHQLSLSASGIPAATASG